MERPLCPACQQRLCAINYHKDGIAHYRSRCEYCIKKRRKIKVPEPRWKSGGYKKKPACDKCGFRAKYPAQLLVYHMDGNLNNNVVTNLKTICANCQYEVAQEGLGWRQGDLIPDY